MTHIAFTWVLSMTQLNLDTTRVKFVSLLYFPCVALDLLSHPRDSTYSDHCPDARLIRVFVDHEVFKMDLFITGF